VNACEFLDDEPDKQHILLLEDVEAAAITSNRFHAPPVITNRSEGDVQIAQNIGGKPSA